MKTMLKLIPIIVATVFFALMVYSIIAEKNSIDQITIGKILVHNNRASINFIAPCRKFYHLEIGFEIDPPLDIANVSQAWSAISGTANLIWKTKEKNKSYNIDLTKTGWSYDANKGLWLKVIARLPPEIRWKCLDQKISIKLENINFNLNDHAVIFYASRDRRP